MHRSFLVPFIAILTIGCSAAGTSTGTVGNAADTAKTGGQREHVDAPGTPAHDHDDATQHKSGDMAMSAPAPGDSPATRSYKASMTTMMQSAPAYTGDADIDFNKQMKVHHQAAIDMAEVQIANGKDAETKALAQEIITAQKTEIARIDAWLAKRGQQ